MPEPSRTNAGNWGTGDGFGRAARKGLALAALFAGWPAIASCLPVGEKQTTLEYQVKAAFLLNFTKFIDWPAGNPAEPFSMCILGNDPFGPAIDRMVQGETVRGRRLAVRRVRPEEAHGCQMIFVQSFERGIAGAPAGLGPGILTVGEGEAFLREGGMIAFVIDNRRVRFDINLRAAENAALRVSSKLLNVARNVDK
jgi:hypothetical protein